MMLTSIEIENFKGFATRQRIDFAPLTLLFGANNAGKSTVLHALIYLHELLERGSADVDRSELGGQIVELGGFARIVHRHESNRAITIRAEFDTPALLDRFERALPDFVFPDLEDELKAAWVEVRVRLRKTPAFHGPIVDRVVIGAAGESQPLVWIEPAASLKEGQPLYIRVNLGHPLLSEQASQIASAWDEIAVPEEILRTQREPKNETEDDDTSDSAPEEKIDDLDYVEHVSLPVFAVSRTRLAALPPLNEPLRVVPAVDIEGLREEATRLRAQRGADEKYREIEERIHLCESAMLQARTFLEMVITGTTTQLASILHDSLHIGPLRAVPPRGFLFERAGRLSSWADGLAAWELLLSDRLDLVERVNTWLRNVNAGCKIVVQQLTDREADAEDISTGHVDKTVRRLLLDTGSGPLVLPSEVGAGISQLIPVMVAAVQSRGGISMVEQPEIHVHPAVQVGLGDLFIEAANRDGLRRTLLIETHSEHLLLRLQRRIRESADKDAKETATSFSSEKLSVVHVQSQPDGVRVQRLRVDERGDFKDPWPQGFFDERFPEIYGS